MIHKRVLASLVFLFFFCKENPESNKILSEAIKAYGGVENLQKYNHNQSTWSVNSPIKGKSEETRYISLPEKARIQSGANQEIRIFNKDTVYRGKYGEKAIKVTGHLSESIKLQFLRMYSPLQLVNLKKNISMTTMGIDHNILEFNFDGSKIKYYFNNKTNLIDKTESLLNVGGREMKFIANYGEYKEVNGVMVAHTEKKYINEMHTADNTLEEIKINASIDSSLFESYIKF